MQTQHIVNTVEEMPGWLMDQFGRAVASRGTQTPHQALADPVSLRRARSSAQGADERILQADALPDRVIEEIDSFMVRTGPHLTPALTRIGRVTVDNPRGTSLVQVPRIGEFKNVREGMNPEDRGAQEQLEQKWAVLPVPYHFLHSSYDTDLEAAWTPQMMESTVEMQRALILHLEGKVFTKTAEYSDHTGYGFELPAIHTEAANTKKWNDKTKTGAQYETDLLGILERIAGDKRVGSIDCYTSPVQSALLAAQFSNQYPRTIRSYLEEMLPGMGMIVPSHGVTGANVFFSVQGDATVRIAMPIPPMVHTWLSPAGYRRHILVVARMAPAFTVDAEGKIGAQHIN